MEWYSNFTWDITNRITLGRNLEAWTIEEYLRDKPNESYGKIDVRQLSDELDLIVKIYSDSTKDTFKIGYKYTDLAPASFDTGVSTSNYTTRNVVMEGETGIVTNVESVL